MTTHRAPADPVGADLNRLLKALKLGALADTLPERAALARQHKLSHIGFLETFSPTRCPDANPVQLPYGRPKPDSTRRCVSTPGPHKRTCAMTAPCSAT
jgi:hypothetical protein